ncbi:MAG TPA: efflux RND transporter permease subunit, partial [Candidatus Sumerlaeota bacterium]|nr:efflux RND transporter permease subunit [Candidatus Sumerlaeota bacterium]
FVPTMTAADSATTGSAMGSPSLDLVRLTTLVENSLKPRFEMLKGVAWVELRGAVLREVNVGVREEVMTRHMITPDKIIEEIRRNNISAEGGVVIESGQRMVLKFHSRFRDVADISRCIIAMEGNHPVYLEDLGEISVIETKPSEYVFQDGVMTVSMDIFREPDSNAILTAREVRRQVAALNSRGDFGIKIAQDRSRDVEVAIGEVIKNAALGMILAMLILWIFVRNIPATIITSLAIPVSIIATFCLMDLQNLSLNLMTLGGLALSAGMLVDNGIVVMENIFRHRSDGMSPPDASVRGVSEVAMAITAATLTTIVVFVPLVYVHGVAGILFRDQALTVVYSLLISLLVALVLLPMMAARIAPARRFASGRSSRTYESFLRGSLKVRWLLVVLFLILIFMTVKYGRRIPVRFFPESVGGRLSVLLEMPSGTSLERMADTAGRIQQPVLDIRRRDPRLASLLDSWHILKMSGDADRFAESCHDHMNLLQSIRPDSPLIPLMQQLVLNTGDEKDREKRQKKILKEMEPLLSRESVILSITTLVGEASGGVQSAGDRIFGTHTARMDVFINPEVMREFTAQDLMKIIRLRAEAVPELKCTFESRDEFLQQILGRDRGDLAVEIHAEDLPDLHKSAALAADAFSRLPGFVNIRTNMVLGEEACIIVPDQDLMLRGSFNTEEITGQIQAYLKGERSEKIKLSQGEMDLVIRNPRTEKEGLDGLFNLEIVSSAGRKEKLSNLVAWRFERTVSEIMRIGQERTVLVMADLQGVRYQDAVFSATSALNSLEWRGARSTWNMSGEEVRRRESFDNLFFALIIATILVYMVIASILESIIHPFTIMLS